MAMMIVGECIGCGACLEECPEGAVSEGAEGFYIDAEICNECEGLEIAQCVEACPVDCIIKAD